MMELVDMPGMSAKFRICRMQTADFKKVRRKFNCPFCATKVGIPEMWVGVRFYMRGGPIRKKSAPDKRSKVRVIKKTMAGVLDYLRWNEERVFSECLEKGRWNSLGIFLKCHPGHPDVC